MQAAKKAVESVKETAANIGASAKSGMEKTKAFVQEKMEVMTAHDPMEEEMATRKKEERMHRAELEKQEARNPNAAVRQCTTGTGKAMYSTTGEFGQPMGTQKMPAMAGQPTVNVVTETETGTGRTTVAHNTRVGGNAPGYATGGGGTYD